MPHRNQTFQVWADSDWSRDVISGKTHYCARFCRPDKQDYLCHGSTSWTALAKEAPPTTAFALLSHGGRVIYNHIDYRLLEGAGFDFGVGLRKIVGTRVVDFEDRKVDGR